jgi:hypothetical protein
MTTNLSTFLRVLSLCSALLMAPAMRAQNATNTLPPVPTSETRLIDAGQLIEQDGKLRRTSVLLTLGGGLLGGLLIAGSDGEDFMAVPGVLIIGGCALVGVGLNLSASGKARKAGLILQGK